MNVMQTANNTRKELLSWNFGLFWIEMCEWMNECKKDHMKKKIRIKPNINLNEWKKKRTAIANIFNEILIPFNDALTRNFIAV